MEHTENDNELKSLNGHTDWILSLTVLPNNRLASGSVDNIIKIWDTTTGKELKTLNGHTDWVRTLAVLRDFTLASGSYDRTIKIWDTVNYKILI